MSYIIWVVFNFIASCLFLWLAYKATIMVRNKFGWGASLLFIFGLLSFANVPKEKEQNLISLTANEPSPSGLNQVMHSTVLEKYPLFAVHLDVVCDKVLDSQELKPVKAMAGQYGFVTGHKWQLNNAVVNYNTHNNTLDYTVFGTIHWKLLGVPVYAQSKIFVGRIAVP